MNKKSYDSIVKEHLTWYKKTLGVTGDGIYIRNKRPYSHILPTGDENKKRKFLKSGVYDVVSNI